MKTKKWSKAALGAGSLMLAAVMVAAVPAAQTLPAFAQGVSEETEDSLLTSNLIQDGSFEGVTADDTGAWTMDVTSEAAGEKGSWEVSTDAHSGSQAITLKGAGNDSGYPEISQKITVLPNTTYYVALRVKNNNTAMSSANLFFGFASEERAEETIYGEQHRWADNSVDKDKIYQNEDESWSAHNGYSLYSARIRTGNETNIRFYVRVQKMNVTIDDISVTYAQDIVSTGSENLLKNAGFEDSTSANALKDWVEIGETTTGFSAGIDDVRTTSAYVPGSNMQDKQIEGCNTLYLVAQSGAEGSMTVGQPVTVEAGSNYAFYANFSKWGEVKATAGVQKVQIGILAENQEDVLTVKTIDGSDISLARYMLASVVANVGENTTVYPFVKVETKGFGTYGAGLYVDECYFFKTALDLPEGKTNLLTNGALEENSDGWWEVGGSSQLGWEAGGADGKAYVSQGDIWLSQWSPYDGIVQSVTLEAGQMYKITAYMRTYLISGASAAYDGLYSPVTVMVIEGDDESVSEALYADDSTDNLTVVAKQNVRFERDDAYMPVNLIFTAETAGTYSVFVGFEGGVENNIFQGGVQIGGVSMYKTSMEELSVEENNDDYSQAIVNTSSDVTVTATGITIGKAMTVSEFTDAVYAAPGYTMTIKDADGNAVTSGDMKSGYTVSVVKDGTEVASYAVTVNAGGTDGPSDPADPTDPDANNAWVLPVVLSVVGVVVVAGVIVAVVLLKKKGKGSK